MKHWIFLLGFSMVAMSCRDVNSGEEPYEPAQRLVQHSAIVVLSHNALSAFSMGQNFWPTAASRRWMDSAANDEDGWAQQWDFGSGMAWSDGNWVRGKMNLAARHWPIQSGDTLRMYWTSADSFAVKSSQGWLAIQGDAAFRSLEFGRSVLSWIGEFTQGNQRISATSTSQWERVPALPAAPVWQDAHWLDLQTELQYVQFASGLPLRFSGQLLRAERAQHCLQQILAGTWAASPLQVAQDSTRIEMDPFHDRRCDASIKVVSGKNEWLIDAW
ncbi:MAG: hypothetical protein ACO3GK_04715 [Bacteroidia bacterium]